MPSFSIAAKALCLAAVGLSAQASARYSSSKTASVSVNTDIRYQELDGFGTSEAFQRAEDVFGKGGLSREGTEHVLDLLFSEEKGAGFAILRNGIGSSNTSDSNFMNSIEPFSPGSPHAKPHYVWDHYNSGQFPLAQQAYDRGLQTLYADAWSAPGYMKTNDDENNGGYLCGVTNTSCATGNWMQAYANYLVQYARFYQQSGVRVTNIGFLNEPQFVATYAGMLSDGTQAADFIRVLARTIRESGMDLKINCCDGIGWEDQEAMMAGLQAGPDPAEQYLSVITGHGYDSPPNFPLSTKKKTWLSEWADLSGDYTPYTFFENDGPGEGMTWARAIQVALVDAHVSGFVYWEGAENATSNSCLINLVGNEIITTKRYWVFAQFSKFARPGAHRVEATSSESLLTVSSFINLDGRVATQMINNATAAYDVSFKVKGDWLARTMSMYLTNNEHNLTALDPVHVSRDGTFKASVPARSMVSFVSTW